MNFSKQTRVGLKNGHFLSTVRARLEPCHKKPRKTGASAPEGAFDFASRVFSSIFETTSRRAMVGLGMGTILATGQLIGTVALAQIPAPKVPVRSYQRSAEIYNFSMAATSGPQRGEEIYYFKCWMCHNDYTIAAGTPAPSLKSLFHRPKLITGQPVSEETVAEKIRNGGPLMPAYRHTLTDADIADLIGYLRNGSCCWDGENPPRNPRYRAGSGAKWEFEEENNLRGGPTGVVRSATGVLLEGIMVQLISQESAVRTTVYSNEVGHYEFPKLPTGVYTLRISRPLKFKAYQRDSVRIDGATKLEDIVLERVNPDSEFLPPTPEIRAQLTGAEWVINLPGTAQQKRIFSNSCGYGCHSYQQIFRERYDKNGWRLILDRMFHHTGSLLIHRSQPLPPGRVARNASENFEPLLDWLATVRGPESKDTPFEILPRPIGVATRAIVTEYELPRLLLAAHDVTGDSEGNIWYTSHRTPFVGKLNPRTGVVTEYAVPSTPGANSGTHGVNVDSDGTILFSENWVQTATRLDPRTGLFTKVKTRPEISPNRPGFGNFPLAPDSFVWTVGNKVIEKLDPRTGERVPQYKLEKVSGAYGNELSKDGKIFAGGVSEGLVVYADLRTGEVFEVETPTRTMSPAKGGLDPDGNAWFGGRGGALVKFDRKTHQITEYTPPTPYVTFYEALPDLRNGEIWAGEFAGGRIVRFNPRTQRWIEYVMPEPYSHNRRTWIDNSTNPVTFWYVDHNGYMVRLQPLE